MACSTRPSRSLAARPLPRLASPRREAFDKDSPGSKLPGMGRFALLTVLTLTSMGAMAWAGGPEWMRPKATAEEKRAEATLRTWEKQGMAAVPEMIEAVCVRAPLLGHGAKEQLVGLGHAVLPALVRAAAKDRCDLVQVFAGIVCHTGQGEVELHSMFLSEQPPVITTALLAFSAVAKPEYGESCEIGKPVVKRLTPALSPLLRRQTGDVLHTALSAAESSGPEAAPLVPDLIANLEKGEVAGNAAAMALGAVGEGAAAAVPALRALLRKGGKWRQRATEALGGIGAPARSALPEMGALLKQQRPNLCSHKPRYSEADAIATAIGKAVPAIGGSEMEPLVPDLVAAFQTMRGCNLLGGTVEDWLKRFAALENHGTAARPLLLSIVEDPDESPALRRGALAALDKVGTPYGAWGRVRGLRKALARKEEIFDRAFIVPAMQIIPPPPPPARTPREFFLCRKEAGLSPVAEPPDSAAKPDRADKTGDGPFANCLHARLCGPDEDDYRATMVKCCGFYGTSPPWFCADR